jgi:hypothetical protein
LNGPIEETGAADRQDETGMLTVRAGDIEGIKQLDNVQMAM